MRVQAAMVPQQRHLTRDLVLVVAGCGLILALANAWSLAVIPDSHGFPGNMTYVVACLFAVGAQAVPLVGLWFLRTTLVSAAPRGTTRRWWRLWLLVSGLCILWGVVALGYSAQAIWG